MKIKIIPHKYGMPWRTRLDEPLNLEELKKSIEYMVKKGFTHIEIMIDGEDKP